MIDEDEPCIVGNVTRELHQIFKKHADETHYLRKIREAVNEVGLFPTRSQINEFIHYKSASSHNESHLLFDSYLIFGEFCIFVALLQKIYNKNPNKPRPLSLKHDQRSTVKNRNKRKLQVFLGGSCNPTTWRKDEAIPFFNDSSITYFNPQVINWDPQLMELEDQAKQTAELLFFVIDNQTRSTASMVEAAFLAGCDRPLILVIKDFPDHPIRIADEEISAIERADLERSHTYLTDLVERMGLPVFKDLVTALNCAKPVITKQMKVKHLRLCDGAQQVKFPFIRLGTKLLKIRNAFINYSTDRSVSGEISIKNANLAFRSIDGNNAPEDVSQKFNDVPINFERFLCLLTECWFKRYTWWGNIFSKIKKTFKKLIEWLSHGKLRDKSHKEEKYDVFLGGTCGNTTWREHIAIPKLKPKGLRYFNPKNEDWSTSSIPLESDKRENCKVLLYVITGDTRGMAAMLEASHYIGRDCDVILCIQNLELGVRIGNEELTRIAVKDYNRARSYLADLANRDKVPVYHDIEDAVNAVIEKLNNNKS